MYRERTTERKTNTRILLDDLSPYINIYMCVCMYVCIYICTSPYIYIYIVDAVQGNAGIGRQRDRETERETERDRET